MALTFNIGANTRKWFEKLLESFFGAPRKARVYIGEMGFSDGIVIRGDIMSTQVPDDKTATATAVAKDAKGHPATVQSPSYSSSDTTIFTVETSSDGLSAKIVPGDNLGTAQLQFSCDADLGDGVEELTGQTDIEIVSGKAAVVEIGVTLDTPTPAGNQ